MTVVLLTGPCKGLLVAVLQSNFNWLQVLVSEVESMS